MKKILFILPSLTNGGLERVLVSTANALVRHGYDITVLTIYGIGELRDELDDRVHFIYKPFKRHIGSYIRPIRNRFYDDGQWETRASAEKLHDYYIGKQIFDVEIGFFRGLPIKIVSGCRNEKTVRLAWVHTDFRKTQGYLSNFRKASDVHRAYSSFDKVVCVSNDALQGFIATIGDTDNLTTIYNLLPVEEIKQKSSEIIEAQLPDSKFKVVLVGRLLNETKGQTRLIDAVSQLKYEGKNISLTIVGDGVDYDFLKKYIRERDADEYISMVGNQPNPYPLIKEADLLVCASYFEGFNLTVAEALICGTPVLTTDCTGPKEILDYGKYGLIVENSTEGLYNGLVFLLQNPVELAKYKELAREREQFFDEEAIVEQIVGLFDV